MAFDVHAARAEFPILARQVHGKPLVYLDSAASAQKPRAVIEAMSHAMEHAYSNVHRGLHTLGNEVTEAYEAARRKVAAFIGCDVGEVVFTKGGTEAINLVAAGLARTLKPGDEILLTQMEHHANIVPWHFLREHWGAVLKFAPVNDDGSLDVEGFQALLSERTKVVAFTHMSNVLGTKNPVRELTRMAQDAGAQVLIDGCQGIVHGPVDVREIGCDYYVFSGHKLYGPTGIGILYGKAERLAALPPYQGGGEMIGTVTFDEITYADAPHRFEAGTPPILEAIGLGAAIDWLGGYDRAEIAEHEAKLYRRVREALNGANWLRVLGEAEGKGAILSFTVDGAHAHDVAQILDRYGVAVRAGTHCAEPLMRRFGVTSSARASFALYNTEEEADAFVDALTRTQAFFA
ncbi:aminotransferase class V-fold PLP-dependent enzyme [Phenylobacterium terrae]|uniref:Cysteine desulfurase n=1 Tax=Phenylobacterium terrae TaxID=2665495 RepID=A0ABW4N3X4_9CAUL